MIYLAYFIFVFYVIKLLVVLSNVLFVRLLRPYKTNYNALVSVLIPARNEEKNIANLLQDLISQDYPNIEIIVFNDLSTDKTEELIVQIAKTDNRISLINAEGLPKGWLGKNFACHNLSKFANGKYLLFLDADVRIKNGAINNSISLAEKYKTGLLSIFPKQNMVSIGERFTVPNMNYILLSLLPLVLVLKSKFSSLAAANGQFMLFDAEKYLETMPHEKFKNNKVEDIEIARYFKRQNISIICLYGNNTIECRMYNNFTEAVSGFSKNVVSFFGNSFTMAVLFWFITTFGFLAVFYGFGSFLICIYLFIVIISRIVISIISRQNVLYNLLLIVPQQLAMGLFIYKAMSNSIKKQFEWKGRNI